jgi:hypothetical protein
VSERASRIYGDNDKMQALVSLCRELQRVAGLHPFFLSGRDAGRLLEVDRTTASEWLFLLTVDEFLKVEKAGNERRATRYRYVESDL